MTSPTSSLYPTKPVGKLVKVKYGKSLSKSLRQDGPVRIFGSNGVTGSHISAITASPAIVVGRKGSIGKVAFSEEPCWPIDTAYFIDEFSDEIDPRYLAFYLQSAQLESLNKAAAIPSLLRQDLETLLVPAPNIDEQRRIVARIQECLSRVEEMERLHAEVAKDAGAVDFAFLRELEALIPGKPVLLENVLEQTRNGRSPEAKRKNHNCSVLTLTAVQKVVLESSYHKGIELDGLEQDRFRIAKGEVYISRANTIELVGLSSFVASDVDQVITFPDLLIRLTPIQDKILPEYLALALRFPSSRKQIQDRAIGSSRSMVKISGGRLKEVKILIPSLDQQSAIFERYIRFSEAAKEMGDSSNGDFSALRNAILRQAFAGEL